MKAEIWFAAFLALALPVLPLQAARAQDAPANVQTESPRGNGAMRFLSREQRIMWRMDHHDELRGLKPDERRARLQQDRAEIGQLSDSQKQKLAAGLQAKWDALPASRRQAIENRMSTARQGHGRDARNRGNDNANDGDDADNPDDGAAANAVNSHQADSTATGGNTMTGVPVTLLTAVVTLLALLFYFWTGFNVGRMRGKHGVKAPAMTGDPEFERSVRVQMNTLEWIVVFLPVLWLATMYFSPAMSMVYLSWLPPVLGIVWIIGRFMYMQGYMAAADKRGTGFMIAGIAVIALFVLDIIGIVMAWTAASAV
ncbi:MAG TPA: MAPEG family protein [Rhizomicrobium sp.]|jgi:glutathione S-transferase|nr:MAPEG family protein [Rhizomicrobium sp.]